jgi:G3E family GTPase
MSLPDLEHETAVLLPELPEDAAAPIKATSIDIDETIDWAAFSVWLSALLYARGDDIMRVKGDVQTPADRLLLQSVRHVVQSPEILPDGGDEVDGKDNSNRIIGRGFDPKSLLPSLQSEAERSRASSCWLRAPVRSMPGQRFP